MVTPPPKPYNGFPLFAHRNGQWAKKIRGRFEYFGVWAQPDAALAKYLADRDYLQAGQVPPSAQTTLADILNSFHDDKQRALEAGEITSRTFGEYEAVCDAIANTLNRSRPVATIQFDALSKLRGVLSTGKNGKPLSPASVKRLLTMARSVFKFANEEMGHTIRYKRPLRPPSARALRLARQERLFAAEEIRALVAAARPQMRAMILLGVNCGFGNADCGTLPISAVKDGWIRFPRPKTGMDRRCPLWPETAAALASVIGDRTEGLVFVTRFGRSWKNDGGRDPIAHEFAKLVGENHRKWVTTFYTLRRTFETVASASEVPQSVIDAIMGHVPQAGDMSAVYRQRVFDDLLCKCVEYVRKWYLGLVSIS